MINVYMVVLEFDYDGSTRWFEYLVIGYDDESWAIDQAIYRCPMLVPPTKTEVHKHQELVFELRTGIY
jgi:hypothetical protein